MATFIPNITDTFPEPYIYKPDLAFYDKMLQRKTALYEQGVSKARSAYESVLNAPLSNKYNIPIRDQYIKQARENLMKIAGADFSQAQNVASAQGIFAPFWEDKFIVQDAQLTKEYATNNQLLESWKNSTDPKIREQYNGISSLYLNNGLNVLKNAERTEEGFSKIERRKAVPFTNIQKFLDERAKEEGEFKIVWDASSPDGAHLVKTTNGERAEKPFSTWATSKIGNNFYEQFNVTGVVEKEERYKQIKSQNPTLTDDQVYSIMGDDVVGEFEKGYQNRKNVVSVEMKRIETIIAAFPKNLTPEYQRAAEQYAQQLIELKGKSAAIDEEYQLNYPGDYKPQFKSNFLKDPNGFFATLAKQRLVDGWAKGRASIQSKEVRENSAYFSAGNLEIRKKEYELSVFNANRQAIKDVWEENDRQWKRDHPTEGKGKDGGGGKGEGKDKEPEEELTPEKAGIFTGYGTTSILQQPSALSVYNTRQQELFKNAFGMTFSQDGLLYFAQQGAGLTDEEMTSISSALNNVMNSDIFNPGAPSYKIGSNPKQAAAMKKLEDFLLNNPYLKSKGVKITGPISMAQALEQYTSAYFEDRQKQAKEKGIDFSFTDKEFEALLNYNTAHENLLTYNANEENRKKILNDYAKANPKGAARFFTKKQDGSYDLLSPKTLAESNEVKQFKSANIVSETSVSIPSNMSFLPGSGLFSTTVQSKANVTPDEIVDAIFSNRFSYNIFNEKSPGGPARAEFRIQNYKNLGKEGVFVISDPKKGYEIIKNLESKIGGFSNFQQEYNKVNEAIVPNLQYFQSRTAQVGTNFSYMFDTKKQGDTSFLIFNEALQASNGQIFIQNEKGELEPANAQQIGAITAAFEDKEKTAENYVEGFKYNTAGGNVKGKRNISFKIGLLPTDSKLQAGDTNLKDFLGKTIVIAINDNVATPKLSKLPANTGYYVFDSLTKGKTVKADDIMRSSGFDFTLTPDSDGSGGTEVRSARLQIKYQVRENTVDPKTGLMTTKLVDKEIKDERFNLTDKTPDEIVFGIKKIYYETLKKNRELQKQYENWVENQKKSQETSPAQTFQSGSGAATTPSIVDRNEYFRKLGITIK